MAKALGDADTGAADEAAGTGEADAAAGMGEAACAEVDAAGDSRLQPASESQPSARMGSEIEF
ncbi:MAG TPA: hypothetical protein VGC79_02215 [Polyangiaceae bacterium]